MKLHVSNPPFSEQKQSLLLFFFVGGGPRGPRVPRFGGHARQAELQRAVPISGTARWEPSAGETATPSGFRGSNMGDFGNGETESEP